MQDHHQRPELRAFLANLARPSLGTAVIALRNLWGRIPRRAGCCGHPGEPGC